MEEWFGPDGKLLGFSDPYRAEPVKLVPNESRQLEFEKNVVFVRARLDPFQELQIDPRQSYEMVLELGTIQFTHHPLFSKEHILSARLEEAFAEYTARNLMRLTERATNKLKALREAVSHTKQAFNNALSQLPEAENPAERKLLKESIGNLRDRIKNYRKEMQRTCLDRDQGYWDDRAALVSVLELWRELKGLRREQGYTNTTPKLSIMEIPTDAKEDKIVWKKAIEEEFNDLKEEYDETYETEIRVYNEEIKKFLAERRTLKKSRTFSTSIEGKTTTQESKSDSDDEDTLRDENSAKKPKPPPKFDPESTIKAIEKRHAELRRQPGEPILMLELLKNASISATNQLPTGSNKEEQRRKMVHKLKVEIKIWFNDKEVYTSKPRSIQPDFSGFLGLSIPISIKEWPECLEIQVIDSTMKLNVDHIEVQLPDSKTSIDRCHTQRHQFSSDDVVRVSNSGVGCGVPFEIMGKDYSAQYPRGFITSRIGWSTDTDGNILCPTGLEKLLQSAETRESDRKLQQFIKGKSDFDPNDPKNAQWLNMKVRKPEDNQLLEAGLMSPQKLTALQITEKEEGFDFDERMKEFEFCTMESIEQSARFRLLHLRDEEVPEFRGLKMVPAFERDIPADIFSQYERRLKEDMRKRSGTDPSLLKPSRKKFPDDESLYESNRLEKIREMRLSVLHLFENSTKQITFEDLVIEEQIPDIGTLGLNLMALFQPRRPLRPTRKERKRVQGSNLIDTKISLIVSIVRAFNLPMRKDTDVGLLTTESLTGVQVSSKRMERGVGNYATVKPFVEVWFQRTTTRTTTALGSNPTWNQELQLNLAVPNDDYSQANLSRMDDLVYFHVYDEVAIDLLEDDRRRETDIHQRLEKRWLGTISIPFSTLYTNGRIEGTFKLNSPPILLGYEAQGMASHFGPSVVGKNSQQNPSSAFAGKGQGAGTPFSNQKNAFITIFLTMQPSVTPSSGFKEDSQSGETADMVAHVKTWKNTHEMKFPDRIVRPFVMTSEGDTILCTRFLKPIEPPNTLLTTDIDLMRAMEDMAHYVSLFPCVRDSTLGIVDFSLWFTSDTFISAPGGGIEDHSVLLACFFMHLNVPCWIVQGNAIPDGPTTFVVSSFKGLGEDKPISKQLKNAVLIWNACTGDYFHSNDNFCPLQRVWAAIGKLNVWAYTGEGERPHQVDWDVGKSKCWSPLFPRPVPENKIPCIQIAATRYKPADQVQANSLAQRIERNLKEVFMKWRTTTKTNWNRYCSATLRRLLPKLEESKLGRSKGSDLGTTAESTVTLHSGSGSTISLNEEHLIELREIMTSYQMTGFPLQQPYTNMECIIETVFATGVHTIDAPDVEFAVAAYAHAYPASVYSVWVYVAALHRRK
ncbi:Coiled-coil and C2 domain-containing protein 2A [Orchesella cincta]|uniref:Coiled-coil and C2 domain-containing protein 2A n=1 Tax=Orchesella cincta TaxID=48709 RepID=A0A1D2NKC3_ORCCI|nr:Coiled-coil and C2 domain-containing protein 2A [Orchesella cincta]